MTPTARSSKWLRDRGWIVARVEQRLHMPKAAFPITKDAFGFGDLLAAHMDRGIALVQVTSTGNLTKRVTKITQDKKVSDYATMWLQSGGHIQVHGWAKRGPRGKRKTYQIKAEEVVLSDSGKTWATIPLDVSL